MKKGVCVCVYVCVIQRCQLRIERVDYYEIVGFLL
jgi:hypothetical protein